MLGGQWPVTESGGCWSLAAVMVITDREPVTANDRALLTYLGVTEHNEHRAANHHASAGSMLCGRMTTNGRFGNRFSY